MRKVEGEMKIWVLDPSILDRPVTRLVDILSKIQKGGLNCGPSPAVMVDCDEKFGNTLLQCLEASGLQMVVEEQKPLDLVVKVNGAGTLKQSLDDLRAAAPGIIQTAMVEAGEKLEKGDVVGPVNEVGELAGLGEGVQVGAGDPAMEPVVKKGLRPCAFCGELFEPKTVKSRCCGKPDCKKAYNREMQKKMQEERKKFTAPVEPAAVESAPEYKEGEPNQWWPWKVIDGADAGRIVTQSTMEFWLKTRRLPAGTMVEHFKRGQHMVDKEDGKKGMILRKVAIPHE